MSQPTTVHAFAAFEAKGQLKPFEYVAPALKPHEIEVTISNAGICATDCHQVDNDWHGSMYPMVPCHEIAGHVSAVGSEVKNFKVGDRVGVGAQRSSCGKCADCVEQDEVFCSKNVFTYNSKDEEGNATYGGFADKIRVNSHFAIKIPDNLDLANAASLFCAGVTVFTPIKLYSKPTDSSIGVVGIGGLGHLALQIAKALGYKKIVAISHSDDKQKAAMAFGATDFVVSSDAAAMAQAARSLDLVIFTLSTGMTLDPYLSLLRKGGRFCVVGCPAENHVFHASSIIFTRSSICGSLIGSPSVLAELLDLAAKHNIQAQIEKMPFTVESANEGLERVRKNLPRYRVVLCRDVAK